MILQLWNKLKETEAVALTAYKSAAAIYETARKSGATPETLAPLDPGRHAVAAGAIAEALHQVEVILGPDATAAAKKAVADAAAASAAAKAAQEQAAALAAKAAAAEQAVEAAPGGSGTPVAAQ